MGTIVGRHRGDDVWSRRRARRQADTALHWRRYAGGLSMASPGVRAFARASLLSLLAWAMILLAGILG